jgi:hypothetical protein
MSEELQTPSELDSLKARAEKLGIAVDGRWGVEKLREVVNAAVSTDGPVTHEPVPAVHAVGAAEVKPVAGTAPAQAPSTDDGEIKSPVEPTKMPSLADALAAGQKPAPADESEGARRNRLKREALALVRVQVSCMDPAKKNLKGELLCVSNRNFGTVQRFIPFNREWHIEKVLYDELMTKEFMVFDREKTGRAGIEVVTPRCVKAYNIAVLPPLTKSELKDLAQRQAMAAGTQE